MHFTRLHAAVCLNAAVAAAGMAVAAGGAEAPMLESRQLNGLQCRVVAIANLVQTLALDPKATPFCQSVLQYATTTFSSTTTTTAFTTTTTFVATGTGTLTNTVTAPTQTAPPVTGPAVTSTVTGSTTTTTTCVSAGAQRLRRQILSGSASAVATPTALAGQASATVTVACSCLNPSHPSTTTTVTQTSVSTLQSTSNVVTTTTATVTTTPTVTSTVTPTTTVTYTPTSTVESCAAPTVADSSCGNLGLEWAYWRNDEPTDNYASWNPEDLQTETPAVSGTETNEVDDFDGYCRNTAASFNQEGHQELCDYYCILWRGFLYAAQDGDYEFSFNQDIDDFGYMWAGDESIVLNGYTADNADLRVQYDRDDPITSYTYTATAGEYIPVRFGFSQAVGTWTFGITIEAPDGTDVMDPNGYSGNVVQFACDGSTVPWQPWGQETSS